MADTEELELTSSWQLLGAGPMLISLDVGAGAKVRFASTLPVADEAGHLLVRDSDRSWISYTGTLNVYAKKVATFTKTVSLTYTTV